MQPKIHNIKSTKSRFAQLAVGNRKFDIRLNDRNYQPGDFLILNEFDPETNEFSGENVLAQITDVLDEPEWLKKGYVVLSLHVQASGSAALPPGTLTEFGSV